MRTEKAIRRHSSRMSLVARGETVIPSGLTEGLAAQIRLRAQPSAPALTPRELDVLKGFARGLSIPQVAAELFIAPSTVKTHTQRLYEKLDVSDRAAAVAAAMRVTTSGSTA